MRNLGKFVLFVLVLGVCVAGNASGISSDIKEVYDPEETMIIEISGNILEPIFREDVEFKRGHVGIPLDYDIKKLEDKYYLWAIVPRNEGNYTLVVNDISTTIEGKVDSVDYEKDFAVLGNLSDYYVKPGFVYAREDFEIVAWLNEDLDKEIEVEFVEDENVILKPGENKLEFSIKDIKETGLISLMVGKYSIPSYVVIGERIIEEILPNLRFKPRRIESKVLEGETPEYPFSIVNSGGADIKGLYLEYDENKFTISPDSEINISYGDQEYFVLTFEQGVEDDIDEIVYAKSGNFSLELSVKIELTSEEEETGTPYLEKDQVESAGYHCHELNGIICSAEEVCSGEEVPSLDEGVCCISPDRCEMKKGFGFWGILIGILIVLIVAGVLAFIWFKYKKTKISRGEIFAKRIEGAEKK